MTRKSQPEPTSVILFGMHDDKIEAVVDALKPKDLKDLTTRELFVLDLHHDVRRYRRQLAEFADSFAQDPAHALEWGNNVVEVAQALQHTLAWLYALCNDPLLTLTAVRDEMHKLIMREARYTVLSSTSAMSNISKDASRCAHAKLYERVDSAVIAERRKIADAVVMHT